MTSSFFTIIIDGSQASSDNKRLAWCAVFNSEISNEHCQRICSKSQTQTINTHFKLLQYKWIIRIYLTPTQLNKYNPNNTDMFYKCGKKGTLYHCLWDCPQIQVFWIEVRDMISHITGITLSTCAKLCILVIFPGNHNLSKANNNMITFCLLQAKFTVAKSWKSTTKTKHSCLTCRAIKLPCT